MSILLESQESSSPVITRAVAGRLCDQSFSIYNFSKLQKIGLRIIGYFPPSVAEWIVPRVQKVNALDQGNLYHLKTKDLIDARLKDYSNCKGKYKTICVGVGLGGATAHIALALGCPFIPQAFVLTLKGGSLKGNVEEYFQNGKNIAKVITDRNPDIMSIQHYDPVHDGWLVKRVNHLRLKLIELPEKYKEFVRKNLLPDGAVVYLEGRARWKQFRTGNRNVFQVGGWGDIKPDEYLSGSDRLSSFAKKEKLESSSWRLNDFLIENGFESEWGSEPGLGEALEEFCHKEGYQFVKISFNDPNDFSRLAYFSKIEILKKANRNPEGVVVEMFSQFDTTFIEQSALIPLWTIFNTTDSLAYLKSMIKYFPKNKPVFFSGLSTFSRTPDMAGWEDWQGALRDFEVINIGSRRTHFPADTHALLDWRKKLEKRKNKGYLLEPIFLSASDLHKISLLI